MLQKYVNICKNLIVAIIVLISYSISEAQSTHLFKDTLDFGDIEMKSPPIFLSDTIQNLRNRVLPIAGLNYVGAPNLFAYRGNLVIRPLDTLYFQIGFPMGISSYGLKTSKIIILYKDPTITDTIYLKGNLVRPFDESKYKFEFSIPKMTYNVGDTFKLPIIVDKYDYSDSLRLASFNLRFNKTMMALLDTNKIGEIDETYHTLKFNISLLDSNTKKVRNFKAGDTLTSLSVIATLGDSISTMIEFLTSSVSGTSSYKFERSLIDGSLTLNNLMFNGTQARLLSKDVKFAYLALLNGNVLQNSLAINLNYVGTAKLKIYNSITGILENTINLVENKDFSLNKFELTRDKFVNRGTYLIVLENENGNSSSIIMVE